MICRRAIIPVTCRWVALIGLSSVVAATGWAQRREPQMRPVVRGRSFAVATMKPEATLVAGQILRSGGNAFDAAVAAQAVLGLVDASNNGVGGDALLLVWDSKI